MKRFISLLFLLCFLYNVKGQTYVPVPMQNCYWQMSHSIFCSQSTPTPASGSSLLEYQVYPNNDTIINTKRYIKFYSQVISSTSSTFCPLSSGATVRYWGSVRQDTAGKKIYLIYPNQTAENLLYNFNYSKGDTVKTILGYYTSPPPGNIPYRIVDSIYYQSYSDGICRKRFRLKQYYYNGGGYTWTQHNYFTEGIGNEVGLNERNYQIITGTFNYNSQEQWGSFLAINNFTISPVMTNTCSQSVAINKIDSKKHIQLFPNPSSNEITINLSGASNNDFYTVIYDMLGTQIIKTDSRNINISRLSSGAYIIKCFITNTNEYYIEKLIKD